MAMVVELALTISLEGKGTAWSNLQDLLKAAFEEKVVTQGQLEQGTRQLLDKLEDMTMDVPLAPIQVGEVLASLVAAQAVDLKVVGQHILEADSEAPPEGEDTMLVSGGNASKLLGVLLKTLKGAMPAEEVAAVWKGAGLKHTDFMPAADRSDEAAAAKFIADFELVDILSA